MGTASVAVLCVDMQNDFVLPPGKLFVREAPASIPHCQKLIEHARSKDAPVFWIIREHDPSGDDVELSRRGMYVGCPAGESAPVVPGSYGVQLVEGLQAAAGEHTIIKKRFSGFFQTHLDLVLRRCALPIISKLRTDVTSGHLGILPTWQHLGTFSDTALRRKQIRTVIICGVQTPNCIRASAFDGLSLGYDVIVPSDATASASPAVQAANLYDMENVGVKVLPTEQLLGEWERHCS